MGILFADDGSVDIHNIFPVFHALNGHCNAMGNFFAQAPEGLFPYQLGHNLAFRLIRDRILVIKGLSVGQIFENTGNQRVCIGAAAGGYRHNLRKIQFFAVGVNGREHILFFYGIRFVDDKDDAKRWDADKCAKAIAEGIMGKKIEEKKTSNVIAVVEYMTEKGVKCYLNVYSKDKLTKCSGHGRYNQTLTIGTDGARNCFLSYKNGEACGKSHCKRPKGTLLHVRNVKDLK